MTIAAPVALDAVPACLLEGQPFQSSAAWWRCVVTAGLPAGADGRFLLARDGERPVGLLPLLAAGDELSGLVTPYTCLFQPVVAAGADLFAVGRAFGEACSASPVLRLDALDGTWSGWPRLLEGFAAAGWRAAWFDAFGNWHATADQGWEPYLARCAGSLRGIIRRKLPRAERDPRQEFVATRAPEGVAAALADYDSVHARSWKSPERHPDFTRALLAAAAVAGRLRMGVLAQDNTPIAAQYWIVDPRPDGGVVATVLKLAHDEAARALSPGTTLTAWMIRGLLAEGVTMLDFGRGDDPYKRLWADLRRQRRGLILARPWRARGAAALTWQGAGYLKRYWNDFP
jgi:hypothetical protein